MGFSKKRLKNKLKADKHVSAKAKEKAKKTRQIQNREQIKASKRKATATIAQKQTGKTVSGTGELQNEINSVDALFASMEDEDKDGAESSDGSASNVGAFHEVGGSDIDDGDLPFDGHDDEDEPDASNHMEELRALREKDPEFYKFLAEQDKALLDFRDDEENEEKPEEGEAMASEAEDDAEVGEHAVGKVLTTERFHRIQEAARDSFTATKAALNAYHTAVRNFTEFNQDDEIKFAGEDSKKKKKQNRGMFRIDDEATFSEILEWTIMNLLGILCHHAGDVRHVKKKRGGGSTKQKADPTFSEGGFVDPTQYARWRRVKRLAHIFWHETLILLNNIAAQPMLEYVLRNCSTPEALCWLLPFQALWNNLIKRCCTIWSTNSSHSVRLLAFMFLRNSGVMALHAPPDKIHVGHTTQFEHILRMVLKAFAKVSSSGYSWRLLSTFRFMENSLIEMLRIDNVTSYRVSYVFVRQLAVILRNACVAISHGGGTMKAQANKKVKNGEDFEKKKKKKNALQQQANTLVAWPFIRAIYFWTKAVSTVSTLKPLAYPLYMITMGAAKSKITNLQHFPFVFHLLLCINRLGSTLEAFVPICSHILKVFDILFPAMEKAHRKGWKQSGGQGQSPAKAPDLEILLRFGETQVSEVITLESVGSSLCFLLTDHLGLLSQSPAFPEIAMPVLMHLKKYSKHCRSESIRQQLKTLASSVEVSAEDLRVRREALNEMPSWNKFLMFDPDSAIAKSRVKMLERKVAEERRRVEAELRDEQGAKKQRMEDEAEAQKPKKRKKAKKVQTEQDAGQQKSVKSDATIPLETPNGEDAVEEMEFSSSSEED